MIASTRILYTKLWKVEQVPRISEWLNKLIFMAEMDKITRKLREQRENGFKSDWGKLKTYIEKKWKSKDFNLN